jgi:hypothetical protein
VNDCRMEAIPVQRRVKFEEGIAGTYVDLVRSRSGSTRINRGVITRTVFISVSDTRRKLPLHQRLDSRRRCFHWKYSETSRHMRGDDLSATGLSRLYCFWTTLSWSSSWIRPSLAGRVRVRCPRNPKLVELHFLTPTLRLRWRPTSVDGELSTPWVFGSGSDEHPAGRHCL